MNLMQKLSDFDKILNKFIEEYSEVEIHKESRKTIVTVFILFAIVWFFLSLDSYGELVEKIIRISTFSTWMMIVLFFRVPKRKFEKKEGFIYAPCDGKVVVIEETEEKEYYNEKRMQISIFMSPLNIHNNLYPISGKIIYKKYHPGKFFFAWQPKASTDNEHCSVVIENKKISLLTKQIAGALARRIVNYSYIQKEVKVSNELGFIKFGSRVDIFLPVNTKINIQINQKVTGGQTIIGVY